MLGTCIRVAWVFLILLAIAHAAFPKRCHWSEELPRLSLFNRQMFLVHCFFVVLVIGSMGILSCLYTNALLERSALAKPILA